MASVSAITSAGLRATAMPFKVRSVGLVTSAGVASSTGRVAWGGSESPLAQVPWIPKAGTPLVMSDGRTMNPAWDRCFRWLFEQYIGGVKAKTASQIQTEVAATQDQVVATTNYAIAAVGYASGVAATASATREVSQASGLSGAESIPDVPDEPRFNYKFGDPEL